MNVTHVSVEKFLQTISLSIAKKIKNIDQRIFRTVQPLSVRLKALSKTIFNTLILSGLVYLLVIPFSAVHYYKIKNKFKTQFDDNEDHEDIL